VHLLKLGSPGSNSISCIVIIRDQRRKEIIIIIIIIMGRERETERGGRREGERDAIIFYFAYGIARQINQCLVIKPHALLSLTYQSII
jgi:hypothetical protein